MTTKITFYCDVPLIGDADTGLIAATTPSYLLHDFKRIVVGR